MKILIAPYTPGGNPYLRLLADALAQLGLRVYLLGDRRWFSFWRFVRRHGTPEIVHLQWHHRYFRGNPFPRAVFRTLFFFCQIASLRAAGARLCWTVHNVTHHEGDRYGWELWSCRLLARIVDTIIVHCPSAIPVVAEAYRVSSDRFQVVPHGHYGLDDGPVQSRSEARRVLGLPLNARVLLFFGWVRAYKGVDRLLTEFARIPGEDIQLIIAGKPVPSSLEGPLSELAAQDRRVTTRFEFVDESELATYLSACDVVTLPYSDSLTSGAAVLAASYGRTVLVPCMGCLKDFPTRAILDYDPDADDGLRDALKTAVSLPLQTLEEYGARARRHVRKYPWTRVAEETWAVYRQLVDAEGEDAPTPVIAEVGSVAARR